MIPDKERLFSTVERTVLEMEKQGYDIEAAKKELYALPFSLDALTEFALKLPQTPIRPDWKYAEPSDWDDILSEMDDPPADIVKLPVDETKKKIKSAFLASVCGCILGKPLEVNPDMRMLEDAFGKLGEWPISGYVSEKVLDILGKRHPSWKETTRENIRYAAADDDINYTVIGMMALEKYGIGFTHAQLANLWGESLPPLYTFGPERKILIRIAQSAAEDSGYDGQWPLILNPLSECCGAMIRADAYGYACAGNPLLASRLAWKDGMLTHRKTGVYGEMFAAAAIAQAFVAKSPLEIFEAALRCVPKRSRFHEKVSAGLEIVRNSDNYLGAYKEINKAMGEFGHCRVYQESVTLVNTLCYAEDIGDGICKQVMQGNDTDSYGCTAGSILGAYFGPGHLDERWLAPFNDKIQLAVARAPEHSLSALADRMANLAEITA